MTDEHMKKHRKDIDWKRTTGRPKLGWLPVQVEMGKFVLKHTGATYVVQEDGGELRNDRRMGSYSCYCRYCCAD